MTTPNDAANQALHDIQERAARWQLVIDQLIKTEAGVQKSLDGLPSQSTSNELGADGDPVHQQVPQVSKSVFAMLDKMKKSETINKTVFQVLEKSETFINLKDPSNTDPKKSTKENGKPDKNLPGDYEPKVVDSEEGSGGKTTKAKLGKDEESPTASASPKAATKPPKVSASTALKPAGVPGDKTGDAPSIPKPPQAPGAKGLTMKSEAGVFGKLNKKAPK